MVVLLSRISRIFLLNVGQSLIKGPQPLMKKLIIFLQVYWVRALIAICMIAALIGTVIFMKYCLENYFALENFSRRQLSAQMALLVPMFIIVHLFSMPLMIGLQYYMMQGGLSKLFSTKIDMARVNVKWNEVIGMEGAKKEAWEIVKLLKDRHLLKSIGGK